MKTSIGEKSFIKEEEDGQEDQRVAGKFYREGYGSRSWWPALRIDHKETLAGRLTAFFGTGSGPRILSGWVPGAFEIP